MISAVLGASTYGINAFVVTIETHFTTKIPKVFKKPIIILS